MIRCVTFKKKNSKITLDGLQERLALDVKTCEIKLMQEKQENTFANR